MTAVVTVQTFEYSAENDVAGVLLRAVARLMDVENMAENKNGTTNGSTATTSLRWKQTNAFTGRSSEMSATGLRGCVRLLMQHNNSCCGGSNTILEEQQAESWVSAAETALWSTIERQRSKEGGDDDDEVQKGARAAFVGQLEKHLKNDGSKNKYLVGDCLSVWDLVVAVLVIAATKTSEEEKLPTAVQAWIASVLQRTCDVLKSVKGPADVQAQLDAWLKAVTTAAAAPAATTTTSSSSGGGDDDNEATAAILSLLQKHGIEHEAYDHVLCHTAEELVKNVPLPSGKETHTKNLFLKDKKHGIFLVTVRPDAKVNTKELGKMLQLKGKTNLRLADEQILLDKLRCKAGSVGPLAMGLAVDSGKANLAGSEGGEQRDKDKVTLVLDGSLLNGSEFDSVHSHPARNDKSVKLSPAALQDYCNKIGVSPIVLEFDRGDGGSGKTPATRPPATDKKPAAAPKKGAAADASAVTTSSSSNKKQTKKGETLLALQWKKAENFPNWYSDVIVLSEMISYYDVSGCYILRPWSYRIWQVIQDWFNVEIDALGVENAYFPLFVTKDRLEREKDHVEGFAPEVAWVTKSGDGDLAQPIAIRPTSETIMYPAFSDWIQSHRDLPLRLNQWSNVVRWEFKYPTPFLRTREFLWQEGHTAHATHEEASKMVRDALELYRRVYEELLAVPVVPGYKTEKEKFAGGHRTTTVEAYVAGSGRAIQGATSHDLGQNFGKMFDIQFQNNEGKSETAWQTSWGLTTRTIGVMVMVHGDDKGLVLPPAVAPLQVIIVPICSKKGLSYEKAEPYCNNILKALQERKIRAKYDDRTMYNPGWKYNHWEQKGVPIRVEVGPRDFETNTCRLVVRHDGATVDGTSLKDLSEFAETIESKLKEIQATMFSKAKIARDEHVVQVTEWKDFVPALENRNLVLTPWCGGEHQDWEEWVKTKSREESLERLGVEGGEDEKTSTSVAAKTLCIPFEQPELPAGTKCIASKLPATCWVLWGRSY